MWKQSLEEPSQCGKDRTPIPEKWEAVMGEGLSPGRKGMEWVPGGQNPHWTGWAQHTERAYTIHVPVLHTYCMRVYSDLGRGQKSPELSAPAAQ